MVGLCTKSCSTTPLARQEPEQSKWQPTMVPGMWLASIMELCFCIQARNMKLWESYHGWLCMIAKVIMTDCVWLWESYHDWLCMTAHWNHKQLKLWVRTEIVSSWNYECALKSWAAEIKSVHWNHEQLKLWVRTEIMSSWYYECALKSRAAKIMSAHWNHEQLKLWVRTEITSKQLSKHITPLL